MRMKTKERKKKKDRKSLLRALHEEPTLSKYEAGQVFGWGRRPQITPCAMAS